MHNYLKIIVIILISTAAYGYDAVGIMDVLTADTEASAAPTSCGQSAMAEVKVCDIGAGFLCVNTPPLSVIDEFVTVRGTIDVKNNVLSSIGLFVQHEYTKEYKQIELPKPFSTADCKVSADYCLDNDGNFAIKAPLGQKLGAYTITITATRSNGQSAKASIKTSRVTKPEIKSTDVTIMPDPAASGGTITQKNIQVDIDLLHSCQACDFFGIATSGLLITLNDTVKSSDGGTKQFLQKTNISSGGRFSMCVPVSDGEHKIRLNACNAATGYDVEGCPFVELAAFKVLASGPSIAWSEPATPIYHAKDSPIVELAFKLNKDSKASSCEENVVLKFNREEDVNLCTDAAGEYRLKLEPQPGINVGVVEALGESYPFTFGWGEVGSPFASGGGVKDVDELWIKNAGGFSIRKSFWVNDVKQLLNNFLMSDEAKDLLEKLPEAVNDKTVKSDAAGVMESIKNEIPYCNGKSSMGDHNYLLKLVDAPKIGLAEITSADIGQDIVNLVLNMEDVKILAQILKDDDFDGEMDSETAFIPLKIAFRKIFAPVDIKVIRAEGKKPLFALTSSHTDCEYKSNNACVGKPALLVPKTYVGGATPGGSFVVCDYKEQAVDDATKAACEGINLSPSHELFATSVLDAINEKLVCDASAALTYILREWMKVVPVKVPLRGREFNVPVGLDLLGNQFNVDANGVFGVVPALVGSPEFYSKFAKEYKSPDVGYIAKPGLNSKPQIGSDFGLAFGEKFLNALLFVLAEDDPEGMQKGLLDWDISEVFFNKLGFDFVKECDAFMPQSADDKPSALCNLRPRVGELLGSALTTSGYFPQKHPIMLRIRGNRRLPPHVSFFNSGGKQYIDLQFGDIDISFYALQVDAAKPADQYGNLALKLDANGEPIMMPAPIIRSKMSALIALELTPIVTDDADPSRFSLTLRPEVALARVVFAPVPGGNATIIKDESLLSAFEEKIKYGINIYSMPENAVKIAMPKEIDLKSMIGDQFNIFGLEKISFGKDGFSFAVEESQEYLDIFTKFILTQTLTKDGKRQEYTISATK